jgi:hypothetical protein
MAPGTLLSQFMARSRTERDNSAPVFQSNKIQDQIKKVQRFMIEQTFDCSGFNFHCPENRGYVIFDPQTQEESERLDALLGATPLWQATIAKRRDELALPGGQSRICRQSW